MDNFNLIKFLAKNSVVMVFCDREYEFLDYIDNYENFREIIKLIQ